MNHNLTRRRFGQLAIAGLPATLQGTNLLQLSELHYDGLRLPEQMLEQAIAIGHGQL